MATETAKPAPLQPAPKNTRPPKKKKTWPTNCTQCNTRIHRKNWYYRNGKYFCGSKCACVWHEKALEETAKAKAMAREALKPASATPEAPAA